ncbi:MAG: APC family permease [Phycisphaerae bacterium]
MASAPSGPAVPCESTAAPDAPHFKRTIGAVGATAINMTQMCGIGPFLTIPAMVAAMGGPQAMFGWVLGAFIAIADGLVWAELGAAMPGAGGTYLYLREAFQYSTGKLVPFLFIWTAMIFIPLIMSTGVIGIAQYVGFFWTDLQPWEAHAIALGVCVAVLIALYRDITEIKFLTTALWIIMLITVGAVILAALPHFDPKLAFAFPKHAFAWRGPVDPNATGTDPTTLPHLHSFFSGLGGGLIIAIYDYLGYNTTAYMGSELKNPGRTIPRAIFFSILGMMGIYLCIQLGVLGVIPWEKVAASQTIASDVVQATWGKGAAYVVTALILVTAAASVFTGLLGGSRVPFNAARDRMFLPIFGKLHPTKNFPHYAVIAMVVVTAIGSLFPLTDVINILTAVMILVQCIAQILALFILRWKQPALKRPYRMVLYPLPAVVALIAWGYLFYSSSDVTIPVGWLHLGRETITVNAMLLAIAWLVLGVLSFLVWAALERTWPFGPREIREEFLSGAGR